MEMYKKIITDQEVEIIHLLQELSLNACTLVRCIKDNILIEYKGKHVSRSQWDICKINEEVIAPFRKINANSFTPGFYSHMNSGVMHNETDYRLYLIRELSEILDYSDDRSANPKYKIFFQVRCAIEKLIDEGIEINQFCLLHGDLYNGNILIYEDKYSMIDFEYVRFGPSQLEWAFLLCWDLITESDLSKRHRILNKVLDEVQILKRKCILDEMDLRLIADVFLPAIVSVSMHFSECGRFDSGELIYNGVKYFWDEEYQVIKEGM